MFGYLLHRLIYQCQQYILLADISISVGPQKSSIGWATESITDVLVLQEG